MIKVHPAIRLQIFTSALICIAITFFVAITGTNFNVALMPTIMFLIFFIISMLRSTSITGSENDIGQNIDAALVCGIAVIAVLIKSPLSFVISSSVLLFYPTNIKRKQWTYLFLNFSTVAIAGSCSFLSLLVLDLDINNSLFLTTAKIIISALVFNLSNYLILALSFVVEGQKWRDQMEDSRKALIESLPLAIFCGAVGRLYVTDGWSMLLFYLFPLIIGPLVYKSYVSNSESKQKSINTLIYALEQKDPYTGGHVERVAKFAVYIGEELKYLPSRIERLRQAALLHDTGKLIVPNELLNKPGKLTDDEFAIVKKHEGVTEEILKNISFLRPIAHTSGGDHNKMDGNLKTKKLEPYIVSVCDAFDAMTSSRSYRKALSQEVAFDELRKNSGKQFHPVVVDALIKAIESKGEHYGDGYETGSLHSDAPIAGVGSAGIGDTIKEGEADE